VITDAIVTIGTANFTQVVKFYEDILQQKPLPYLPLVYAQFSLPGLHRLHLGIFKPQASQEGEFSKPQGSGFSLCLEVRDLNVAIAQITRQGYPVNGKIMVASHGREIYVYDPDGNRLIFHQSHEA
jgi:predicted enzyme related to lactoylglutathione lyase